MPRTHKLDASAREKRLQERQKNSSELPSEIFLCVLGNGSPGSPRSLYMSTTHSKYLFNCGEGTQRLAHEYKLKLSKLEHIFITHKSWDNLAGLPGLSLTIQDINVPEITIHGPPDVDNIYSLTRKFVLLKHLRIGKKTYNEGPFVDGCMSVEYVPIFSTEVRSVVVEYTDTESDSDTEHRTRKKRKIANEVADVAVAYICKGHKKKGRLLLEKCTEFGVPKGPLLRDLKNGNDIKLPCGKTVYSRDVTDPEEPCPVFLVVECPAERFLDPFVNEERFFAYQSSPKPSQNAQLVVHFTPENVLQNSKYQSWMNRFPTSTCHLILNERCSTVTSVAIHRLQHMLNLFHPNIFSLLHESELSQENIAAELKNKVYADTLCKYYLRPNKGLDKTSCVCIEPQEYISEALGTPGFEECLEQLRTELDKHSESKNQVDDYPELTFLGTGSCIPSKIRNVSGILLNLSSDSCMLLDCGEGSYKQLLRFYGPEETESVLIKLSCIFISHMHADHHLGLFTILKRRRAAFQSLKKDFSPVIVIAPERIGRWLSNFDRMFESLSELYRFIENSALIYDNVHITASDNQALHKACKETVIRTVPVVHCSNAYGIVLELKRQRNVSLKLVYSGDTMPSAELIEAGADCQLLIHEATMEDDLENEAEIKRHSTTSQAIDVAEKMRAQYTILTHFSQRYAKVPLFNERFKDHIGFAFDNMKVRFCDLPIIPMFIPALQTLFADHVEKLQDKGTKRKEKNRKSKISVSSNEDSQ